MSCIRLPPACGFSQRHTSRPHQTPYLPSFGLTGYWRSPVTVDAIREDLLKYSNTTSQPDDPLLERAIYSPFLAFRLDRPVKCNFAHVSAQQLSNPVEFATARIKAYTCTDELDCLRIVVSELQVIVDSISPPCTSLPAILIAIALWLVLAAVLSASLYHVEKTRLVRRPPARRLEDYSEE
ncbi:unnamed protein product [Heligmosomoides polygyrus]|uniref:Uncharacterized protein n=1 Tax=Heligmosomoides polygyrus TaxID=6339 RepID=A0A183FH58_HELPZ|nr:unnamed protein product [Heligmosomoides polygyrus]